MHLITFNANQTPSSLKQKKKVEDSLDNLLLADSNTDTERFAFPIEDSCWYKYIKVKTHEEKNTVVKMQNICIKSSTLDSQFSSTVQIQSIYSMFVLKHIFNSSKALSTSWASNHFPTLYSQPTIYFILYMYKKFN